MARNLIIGSLLLRDWSDAFGVLNSHGDRGLLTWWHSTMTYASAIYETRCRCHCWHRGQACNLCQVK